MKNSNQSLTIEDIDRAIKEKYELNINSPQELRENADIVRENIKKYGLNKINFALGKGLITNIDNAINQGYRLSNYSPQELKNNGEILRKFIIKYGTNQVDYATDNAISENLDLIKEKKYKLHFYSPQILKEDISLVYENINNYGANQIDYAVGKSIYANIDLAINMGYKLSLNSPQELKENASLAAKFIKKYGNEQINYIEPKALTKTNLELIKQHDIEVNIYNYDKLNNALDNTMLNENLKDLSKSYQEKLLNLSQFIGLVPIYFEINNSLFSEKVIDKLGINFISKIYKYFYLTNDRDNFRILADEKEIDNIKILYEQILEKSFDNLDILDFKVFFDKYIEYKDVLNNILNNRQDLEKEKPYIKYFFTLKNTNININSITDLKNIDTLIYNDNQKRLKSNDIQELKEIIYLLITNNTKAEIITCLNEIINSHKATLLMNSINDKKIKAILKSWKIVLEIIESINESNNLEEIRRIAEACNEKYMEKNDFFADLKLAFEDINKKAKYFYGYELNQNLTKLDLDKFKNNENIFLSGNKYISSNSNLVKYIEFNEECYFLVHAMNADGNGAKLSDWKYPRVIGSTYLCLSTVTNNKKGVSKKAVTINDVTLVFDNIKPKSLMLMADRDISTNGIKNKFNLSSHHNEFNTLKETLNNTTIYNEYVCLRENEDGSVIYPSGVLVTGDNPTQVEVDAADYLGVPLIKINPIPIKNNANIISETENIESNSYIDKLKDIKQSLTYLKTYLQETKDNTMIRKKR